MSTYFLKIVGMGRPLVRIRCVTEIHNLWLPNLPNSFLLLTVLLLISPLCSTSLLTSRGKSSSTMFLRHTYHSYQLIMKASANVKTLIVFLFLDKQNLLSSYWGRVYSQLGLLPEITWYYANYSSCSGVESVDCFLTTLSEIPRASISLLRAQGFLMVKT